MSALFSGAWLAEALVASALLIAAVLALRSPVRRAFGPRVAYVLWALPALRLALPPLPAWPAAATPVTLGRETIVVLVSVPQAAVPVLPPAFPFVAVLTALWAAGAVALLLHHAIRHRAFVRAVLARGETFGAIGGIRLVVSDAAPGPLAFGVWRRTIAVPRDFGERYDPDERALALEHEVAHHRRGDLLANWIGLAVLACHWFNPLAWAAWRAFRSDQELANDAHVLARHNRDARQAYASAIVKSVRGPAQYLALPSTCHLHTVRDLKGRLSMLTRSPASRRRLAAGGAAVSILVAAGLVTTASGTRASAAVSEGIAATGTALVARTPVIGQDGPNAPPAPPGPTAPGSGGRHVATVRDGGAVHVTVTEEGRIRHYEGAAAEAWLAANPQPTPPVPPVPPAPPVAAGQAARVQAQARTIVVRPDERGAPTLMVGRMSVAPGGPLPPGVVLPRDFDLPKGCGSTAEAPPPAMVFKGEGGDKTYTVLCTRPGGESTSGMVQGAYRQALAGLRTARRSIETQVATPAFPESERRNALAAVDTSIAEIESDLAQTR